MSVLERLEPMSWETRTISEGWPVALVACHVSIALRRQAGWVERVLRGQRPHAFDWERSHALNALVARRVVRPAPAPVLEALRAALERWRRLLELLSDEDLDRVAFRQGSVEKTAEWVAETLVPRHVDEHLRSIRAALAS